MQAEPVEEWLGNGSEGVVQGAVRNNSLFCSTAKHRDLSRAM